jgi:23S rRNA (uracil1939-C5)-methyltransferase
MVKIENPIYGGNFSTDAAGTAAFVLPGERVVLSGDMPQVVESSPHRVAPRCVHFGVCGGCQYQHASYPAQLRLKLHILKDIFLQSGLQSLPEPEIHHGPEWGYRNRIRLRVESGSFGYSRRASNDFLPIQMCPIAAPLLWHAAETLKKLGQSDPAVARWLAATSELELFCTPDESRLQATFFLHSPENVRPDAFAVLCERLRERLPQLTSAGAVLDPELNRRSRRKANWPGAAWGAEGLAYPAAGRSYWVPRGAFFQVNRFLIDDLVALVCGQQAGELAWDLFAGVGLFTRKLASHFKEVIAVEGSEIAASALATAGKSTKESSGFTAIHSATLDFLRARQHQRDRPQLVVLDPPRAGLGQEGAEILTRIAPEWIVYVSCDPTTLARDLAVFQSAYAIEEVHLIDLFPQTFHMETVVKLRRLV